MAPSHSGADVGLVDHVDHNKDLERDSSDPQFAIDHDHPIVPDKLARKLSARQIQMIAIGGTIGTGLFLGTGKSLAVGGPASMLIAYIIVGGIVMLTMLACAWGDSCVCAYCKVVLYFCGEICR
jgi:AAT family amino acid transporter